MTTLLIRNLETSVYEDLKAAAKAKGCSIAAEARDRLGRKTGFDRKAWLKGMEEAKKHTRPASPGNTILDIVREMREDR